MNRGVRGKDKAVGSSIEATAGAEAKQFSFILPGLGEGCPLPTSVYPHYEARSRL